MGRNAEKHPIETGAKATQPTSQGTKTASQNKRGETTQKRRKPMVITCPPGQYEETMKVAKERIHLKDCGVKGELNFKRALTGALTLEFPGPAGNVHVDNLASKLRTVC